jgi:hypothetical protein
VPDAPRELLPLVDYQCLPSQRLQHLLDNQKTFRTRCSAPAAHAAAVLKVQV